MTTDPTQATVTPFSGATKYLSRGTIVGRYVVLDRLGEGGMGVVYRAFDPELDRMVALKLLQAQGGGSSGGSQAWLLREAQALARLAHPNVVVVHDVGLFADDQVFVAMELVDGLTLHAWLALTRRTWREVQAVMVAAGAGLAAAHAAGLVHRDFKPENVIVGADKRVRVMDFGLARLHGDDTAIPDVAAHSPLRAGLTVVDGVIGTPAYMAPEIFDGHAADARSDQFSFGVALFEALCGVRPFAKLDGLPDRTTPKPQLPADAKVPTAIAAVALRAIAIDPAERYPSLDALIAELAIDPTARRRRIAIGVAALVVLGGAIAVTMALSGRGSQLCKGADKRLAGIWDPAVGKQIHDAFVATKLPIAAAAYGAFEHALDNYVHGWIAESVESCEATRVRRDQTEDVLSLRQECLDRRLEELRALTRLLATEPLSSAVEKGEGVVFELEPITRCGDIDALRSPAKPPPGAKSRELEAEMAVAKANVIAARFLPALVDTQHLIDGATQIGYEPIAAEAHMVRGMAFIGTQNGEDAFTEFSTATRVALGSRRDDIAAKCAFNAATLAAATMTQPREAKIWLAIGIALARRSGADPMLDFLRYGAEGIVDGQNGDPLGAVKAHETLLAAVERMKWTGPRLLDAENKLATTLIHASAFARAATILERIVAQEEALFGPNHPYVALTLSNLGVAYGKVGDVPHARAAFDRAIKLRERLFGAASPVLLPTLDNLADMLDEHGNADAALPVIERAMKIATPLGTDDVMYQTVATSYAEILVALHRRPEARAVFDALLPVEQRGHSTVLTTTLTARAELALVEHAWADAVTFAERAIAELETAGGKDNPDLWQPLGALGRAKLELGQLDAARAALDRALAIASTTQLSATYFEPLRTARARL